MENEEFYQKAFSENGISFTSEVKKGGFTFEERKRDFRPPDDSSAPHVDILDDGSVRLFFDAPDFGGYDNNSYRYHFKSPSDFFKWLLRPVKGGE